MNYTAHVVTAAAGLTAAASYGWMPDLSVWIITGTAAGALLPDIDAARSWIGRRIPVLSHAVSFLFGHRGVTHSILPVAALIAAASVYSSGFLTGLTFGYAMHVACDMFSKAGVPLFAPFITKRFAIPLYRTGGMSEYVIVMASLYGLYVYWP
ncbi:metal-dependent hydrolase [Salisediminibacterium halotolerans]|uniref:Inner membrane protein n=1 Tax=Salisediminibacterium halotolerans TaxID=517425 RepID=A0A1H9ULF1_9BACI|nr:metal-dependent hydrolase [Salisediminibacterium haloalkalitolerans]SES10295.1 inner membrane protein [Salisediminibacterium haloalkalitolerans]